MSDAPDHPETKEAEAQASEPATASSGTEAASSKVTLAKPESGQAAPSEIPSEKTESASAREDSAEDDRHAPDSDEAAQKQAETAAIEDQPLSLGRFNACFNGLSKIGPLALLFALACMAWPMFWEPGVYCPAEIRSLTAFLHCVADGSWLAPTGLENGIWTQAQWPLFGWCIGLMALSPTLVATGYLLPATSFLCTFFAIMGVWCLAHSARFGYRAAFAAGLILLCSPLFAPLPHFMGPATLAAGCFLFALVFFCRGWRAHTAWISLPLAFVLTAFAGLAGGILPFLVPLLASFCYLIWRGELGRAHRADAIFGFILMLCIIGCWLGAIMLEHPNDAYLGLLFDSAWRQSWQPGCKWLLPVIAGILGTMPWILMIFGMSWLHILANAGKTFAASRRENGSALIWIGLTFALLLAIFIPWFHPSAVIIACLVCILLGKAATNLRSVGGRFFYFLAALALIIAGIILLCVSFSATQGFLLGLLPHLPVPDLGQKLLSLSTLPILGGIVLVGGIVALMFAKRFSGCGPLIYGICLVVILCQPARLALVPELAAMPGTPLVQYSTIQAQVDKAMAPAQPTAAPELVAPEQTEPELAVPEGPAQPEAATPAAPEAPAYVIPPTPENAAPIQELTSEAAQPASEPDQENQSLEPTQANPALEPAQENQPLGVDQENQPAETPAAKIIPGGELPGDVEGKSAMPEAQPGLPEADQTPVTSNDTPESGQEETQPGSAQ